MEPEIITQERLMVGMKDDVVWIKISGKATLAWSADLKNLVMELWRRGHRKLVFDLRDCILMDSTFMGGVTGLKLMFTEENARGNACSLEIANPNARITDLIETLGIAPLFNVVTIETSCEDFVPSQTNSSASREEITRHCLEAHKTLTALNEANIVKFTDVIKFLEEDLEKIEQREAGNG
ncbi:MAG: STAS domain-containing protein [Verrucomicrobiota bacterium]